MDECQYALPEHTAINPSSNNGGEVYPLDGTKQLTWYQSGYDQQGGQSEPWSNFYDPNNLKEASAKFDYNWAACGDK